MLVGSICARKYSATPKNPLPHWKPSKHKSGNCGAYVPYGQACWKCGAVPYWCKQCKGTCAPAHRKTLEAQAAAYAKEVESDP